MGARPKNGWVRTRKYPIIGFILQFIAKYRPIRRESLLLISMEMHRSRKYLKIQCVFSEIIDE